ncbi:hypothetical protein [Patiriisocius sp. Uisw_017]|jgi:hypothetical protein|uniref:hypothetical protein n=1 Tax=Patiriisocius sp. Uisw_017 TaxID=3230968 RepID=UPI0039E8BEC6
MKSTIFSIIVLFVFASSSAQNGSKSTITEKDGKIGIGTNTPDELLTVKGKIHAQEVLVDLNGAVAPDYVFEKFYNGFSALNPSYTMMDLKSLDTYLKENKHLPEIPSAQTLAKTGLELKKMNLLLLQKIEELTLYTIQQQKEIEGLKTDMKLLKKD